MEKPKKRFGDAGWLDSPDEQCWLDSQAFQDFRLKVADILSVLDRWPDGRVKGWSVPELLRALGDDANPRWIYNALKNIDNLVEDVSGSLIRYRILDRPVKDIYGNPNNFRIRKDEKQKV
jgi:hypothetical protein